MPAKTSSRTDTALYPELSLDTASQRLGRYSPLCRLECRARSLKAGGASISLLARPAARLARTAMPFPRLSGVGYA
jgi:hypothetical protein